MAMFYDWRDRTGKEGIRPLREQLKELCSPLFIIMGVVLLILLACSVVYYVQSNRKSVETEKVYLLPDPSEQRAVIPETRARTVQNAASNHHLDLDVINAAPATTPDAEFLSSGSMDTEVELDDPMFLATSQDTHDVRIEPTLAELETIDAETERVLIEGEITRAQAMDTLSMAIPMLAKHLKHLPSEKQQDFLDQVKSQVASASSHEIDNAKGYNLFLEMLRKHGYESR